MKKKTVITTEKYEVWLIHRPSPVTAENEAGSKELDAGFLGPPETGADESTNIAASCEGREQGETPKNPNNARPR